MKKNQAFIANLRRAIFDRKTVTIAGGEFSGDELKEALRDLEAAPDLLEALEAISKEARALNDYREDEDLAEAIYNAEAAIAKAKGGE